MPRRPIRVGDIDPNPHHSFDLHPLEQERIDKLKESYEDTGFWNNFVVRPHPTIEGRYQQAHGHHRLEAARQLFGDKHKVDLPVMQLDDQQMLTAMIRENTTQQGYNATSILDSTAALVRYVSYLLLRFQKWPQDGHHDGHLKAVFGNANSFGRAKSEFLQPDGEGIGWRILVRAAKGALPKAEIELGINTLKDSGRYAALILEAQERVDAERAAEQQASQEEAQQEAAEADKCAEEAQTRYKQKQALVTKRRNALKAAEETYNTAVAQNSDDLEECFQAKEAAIEALAKATEEFEKASKDKNLAKSAKDSATSKLEEIKAILDMAVENLPKERALVERMQHDKEAAVFDDSVGTVMLRPRHLKVFKNAVLDTKKYGDFYRREQQLAAAKAVVHHANGLGWEVTGENIVKLLNIFYRNGQLKIDKEEQKRLKFHDKTLAAEDQWDKAVKALNAYITNITQLAHELKEGAQLPMGETDFMKLWNEVHERRLQREDRLLLAAGLVGAKAVIEGSKSDD